MFKKSLSSLLALLTLLTFSAAAYGDEAPETESAWAELLNGGAYVNTFPLDPSDAAVLYGPSFYEPAYPEAYAVILEGLRNRQSAIDLSGCTLPKSALGELYTDVVNSHAELFYVAFGRYSYLPDYNGNVVEIYPNYSEYATDEYVNNFREAADRALSKISDTFDKSMTDTEIALAVHDWLVGNCEYDYENYLAGTVPHLSYTSYGVFVNGIAVCNGYGTAYKYLLNAFGIDCEYIGSDAMNHGWNLVKIDGEWYHVDSTWDDPVGGSPLSASHTYFLLSDEKITEREHYGWTTPEIPECTDTRFESGFVFNDSNSAFHYQDGAFLFTTTEGLKRTALDGSQMTTLIDNEGLEQQLPESYADYHNTYFTSYCRMEDDLVYGLCQFTVLTPNDDGGYRVTVDYGVRVYDLKTGETEVLATGLKSRARVALKDGVLSWSQSVTDAESGVTETVLQGSADLYDLGYLSAAKIYKPLVKKKDLVVIAAPKNVQSSELLIDSRVSTPLTGKLLICYYNDGVLADFVPLNLSLSAGGEAMVSISHDIDVPYDSVQYMLWDGFEALCPLGDFAKVS